jgi:hypothetical protein
MPAMTNLLIKDDAATPKEWTLVPISDTPVPFWRGNDANVPLDGQPRLTAYTQRLKNGSYKVTAKLEVPTMETLGASGTSSGYVAPPKVAYVTTFITTMFADKRSTSADRANALKMHVGFIQGASATTANGTFNQTAAGDAWKTANRDGIALFSSLILPN